MNSALFKLLGPCARSLPVSFQTGRFIHFSIPCSAGKDWRKAQGLPENSNASGPLTELPDYTFLDGRRTPVGSGKLRRAKEQEQLAQKIITLSSEIDFAIERQKDVNSKAQKRRQSILDRKLKAKGEITVPH